MGYVIFGAGSVGGVIGGRLQAAGADVALIARGAHLDALRASGLLLVTPTGARRLDVIAVGDPGELELDGDDVVCWRSRANTRRRRSTD